MLTVGNYMLDYSGDVAGVILINSTLSTAYAAMMMMDIKNTPLALLYQDLNT
jgi:hypothetical protein